MRYAESEIMFGGHFANFIYFFFPKIIIFKERRTLAIYALKAQIENSKTGTRESFNISAILFPYASKSSVVVDNFM
jgi:hypothetical protein